MIILRYYFDKGGKDFTDNPPLSIYILKLHTFSGAAIFAVKREYGENP